MFTVSAGEQVVHKERQLYVNISYKHVIQLQELEQLADNPLSHKVKLMPFRSLGLLSFVKYDQVISGKDEASCLLKCWL